MILRGDIFSQTLEMDTGLSVVAPNAALSRGGPYKTCYLLHGLCGSNGNFVDYSLLPAYTEELETIFIMPETGRSFYADMEYGQRFFSYVAEELPTIVGRVFAVSQNREDTEVMGVSMGGYGALKCALSKPERYGRCGAFSSGPLFLREGLAHMQTEAGRREAAETYGKQLMADFAAAFGPKMEWRPENDLTELANAAAGNPAKPAIYMTCGDRDFFAADNRRFHDLLKALEYDVVYEELPGTHNWDFFNAALKRALDRKRAGN